MKWPTIIAFTILILACSERVEIGERVEASQKTSFQQALSDEQEVIVSVVCLSGELSFEDGRIFLVDKSGAKIALFPVGFEVPEGLRKVKIEGRIFYHEELEASAIAVSHLAGRFSGGRKALFSI